MADDFKTTLRELGLQQRKNGHIEFRIAAMRLLAGLNAPPSLTLAISNMEVDRYLTKAEIATRAELP